MHIMASFNSTDADVESLNSTDTDMTDFRCFSSPVQGFTHRFLVFDCEENSSYFTAGKFIEKKSSPNKELITQRDLIVNYGRPFCSVINHDMYGGIFGSEYENYLDKIHSIIVFLPCSREEQITFFVSKRFSNSPVNVCQNEILLESHAPFLCKSLPKPVTLDNIQFIKHQLSEDNIQFCCQKEDAETCSKVEDFNMCTSSTIAYYFSVIKHKSNIVKFVFHKSYQSSQTLHIECLSTDTIGQVLKSYLKNASKDLKEFCEKDLWDIAVTDDIGDRIDTNKNAINCLLFNEQKNIRDNKHLDHSYPTFLVHLTPKENSYLSLKVRVHGEERGHMHPLTVFIRNNCSTGELKEEISKHCHWNPKSFEVCLPNSQKCIEEVEDINGLKCSLNSNSVLTVRRVKKLSFTIESALSSCQCFVIEAYPYLSVEELKSKISKRCDILPKQFDLMYKSKILDDQLILENIVEKKARVTVVLNENRIVFRLYLHKGIPNRAQADIYDRFVHLKVDDPTDEIGDITKWFSEKLHLVDADLHLIKNDIYLEKCQLYRDVVSDGTILCLYHSENFANEDKCMEDFQSVFQVTASGIIEKVAGHSVEALERKLRKLQMKQIKSEPNFKVISIGQHKRKLFNRMISVPPKSSRNSTADERNGIEGYKSDTDLIRRPAGPPPKPSPSDTQLFRQGSPSNQFKQIVNRPSLKLGTAIYDLGNTSLTPPLSPPLGAVSDRLRHNSGPGTTGYNVNLTVWSQNEGNLPKIASIIGQPSLFSEASEPVYRVKDPWNRLFLHIHKQIVSNWKNIGRYLHIEENNIDIIDKNTHQVEEKAYAMLKKWRECKGQEATKEVLVQALEDAELKIVAEMVEDFFKGLNNEDISDLEVDGLDEISYLEADGLDENDHHCYN